MTQPIRSDPLVVAAPPPPPPKNVADSRGRVDVDIEAYEKIFAKCMDSAARILEEKKTAWGLDHRILVARAIFNRFYEDQCHLK